jgi:2,7-dihydroxy-5-methyl-1-naphthoate 7-O-methyltransferase
VADQGSAQTPAEKLAQLADLATPFALRTAVTLRIPDQLAAGPESLAALAKVSEADPDALGRLLRYLVHKGVFVESAPELFGLTDVGQLLVDRSGGGHGAYFDLEGLGGRMDLALAGLPYSIRTGQPGYASVHGRDLWADLDAQPKSRAYFDELMRSQQEFTAPQVAELYPWAEVGRVTDVGGGSGGLLLALLTAYPRLHATVVDRPEPVATAARRFAESGVDDRGTAVVGDFFQELPGGSDVYVVSRVLTDWSDAHAGVILRRSAEAAGPTGKVLVVEVLPTEPYVPHLSAYDLQMLVLVGGRERSGADHAALAATAGLAPARTFHGRDGLTLLEFVAAG